MAKRRRLKKKLNCLVKTENNIIGMIFSIRDTSILLKSQYKCCNLVSNKENK